MTDSPQSGANQPSHPKDTLTMRIFAGLVLGFGAGLVMYYSRVAFPDAMFAAWVQEYLIDGVFLVFGKIFVNLLKLMIVPLVLVSLICGVIASEESKSLGRLGSKTFVLYLLTTGVAITLALVVAQIFDPGAGADLSADFEPYAVKERPPFVQVLINIFPDNPMQAMAEGNMLQVIVFAILVGIALNHTGQHGRRIGAIFEDLNVVVMKLVQLIMQLAPYGVFFLVGKVFAEQGIDLLKGLGAYMGCVLLALALHFTLTYLGILTLVARLNPLIFMRKMRAAQMFAFSTASSAATMPVTMGIVEKKLGVRNSVASFTIPLGTTINMDGTAIMQGVATVFIASAYGIELGMAEFVTVIATATLASIGTAAVPSAGMITLAMVLGQVGLPAEAIGLILGVDRILDMVRTAVNITGDAVVTCTVARSEGALDQAIFDDPDVVEVQPG
ncbi:MAG: dicarboxylate/amino acid:cation symporter [Ketobacter sp.]|uniref:dicarboxylate/amino acid:cation symporter n=1 Tax=unclassified Ketobacter TaxID=2639109 RepID=UPI0025C2E822|nr:MULTISPECIES: dicarboxylate/amino acid:cation symporter [unclassified Ketobacter]